MGRGRAVFHMSKHLGCLLCVKSKQCRFIELRSNFWITKINTLVLANCLGRVLLNMRLESFIMFILSVLFVIFSILHSPWSSFLISNLKISSCTNLFLSYDVYLLPIKILYIYIYIHTHTHTYWYWFPFLFICFDSVFFNQIRFNVPWLFYKYSHQFDCTSSFECLHQQASSSISW